MGENLVISFQINKHYSYVESKYTLKDLGECERKIKESKI